MVKTRLCIWLLLVSTIFWGLISCTNKDEETLEEENNKEELGEPLVDKPGYVFLDNGDYIPAKTDFTDAEVLELLQSRIWVENDYGYIYDKYKIKQLYGYGAYNDIAYYRFNTDKSASFLHYDVYIDSLVDKDEYDFQDKTLMMHYIYRYVWGEIYSEHKEYYTLVGIMKDSLIFDWKGKYPDPPIYFPKFDELTSRKRFVWKTHKMRN